MGGKGTTKVSYLEADIRSKLTNFRHLSHTHAVMKAQKQGRGRDPNKILSHHTAVAIREGG